MKQLLLVATVRSAVVSLDDTPLTSLLRQRHCKCIRLQPLAHAEVASWLNALRGQAEAALSRAVHRISEGNPFVMVELARHLRHHPELDAATLGAPKVVVDRLRESLADLSAETLSVLKDAAAIGRKFSLALLCAVTGIRGADLIAHLDEAAASAIVKRSRRSTTEFSFVSDLLRTTLLDLLSPAERRAQHLRILHVLDARHGLAEVPISDLAEHAYRALPEGDPRKAVHYAIEAANASTRAGAFEDAAHYVEFAREALELVELASPRLRFSLLLRQAVLVRGHSVRRFRPLAEQLLQLAREQASGTSLAQAALLLDPGPGCPPPPVLRGMLADALTRLPKAAPEWRPSLLARLATMPPLAYSAAASCEQLEHALRLAVDSHESVDHFCARLGELYLYGGPAHEARAAATLAELQRMCGDSVRWGPLAPVLLDLHVAITALQRGNVSTAIRALERGESHCRHLDGELSWHFARFRAVIRIGRRGTTEARAALFELHRRARGESRSFTAELFCAFDQSVILATRISPEARRVLRPGADDPPNIWALKVRTLAAAGLWVEARNALSLVPADQLVHLPCDRDYLGTLGALARASLRLKAVEYSRALYSLLAPYPDYFAVNLSFLCEGLVSDILRALARSFGERPGCEQDPAPGAREGATRERDPLAERTATV